MDNNPSSSGGDVLVVAHSHLLRILACRWLNMPPEFGKHFIVDTAVSNIKVKSLFVVLILNFVYNRDCVYWAMIDQ